MLPLFGLKGQSHREIKNEPPISLVTFGSCLSRFVANHYVRLFGGEIKSSVYHNRSDYFYKTFISHEWKQYEFNWLQSQLLGSEKGKDKKINPDEKSLLILKNQYIHGVGCHRLSRGKIFFDALDEQPDLLVMDNYMDLAGRLVKRPSDTHTGGVFLRLKDFGDYSDWKTGAYLGVEEAVGYMEKIVKFIKSRSPNTKIFFLNFPYTTYHENKCRVNRHKKYEAMFNCEDVCCFKCMHINKEYRSTEKQHFKGEIYAAYAGQIHASLKR